MPMLRPSLPALGIAALLACTVPRPATAAKLRGPASMIVAMKDGNSLFVSGTMKCYLLKIPAILASDPAAPDDRPLAEGYPCVLGATNGDDSAAIVFNSSLIYSDPTQTGTDLQGGYLVRSDESDTLGGIRRPRRLFGDAKVMRFPSDGRSLAIGDAKGRISVLSLPDGASHDLDRLDAPIEDIRFAAGDGFVLALDRSGRLGVWDWQSERPAETSLPPELRFRAIATAAEASVAALWGDDGKIRLLSTDDWAQKKGIAPGAAAPTAFELSRNGKLIAYAAANAAEILDTASGAKKGHLPLNPASIRAVAFLLGDKRLAVGTSDGRIGILDIPSDLQNHPWVDGDSSARTVPGTRPRKTGLTTSDGGLPVIPPPVGLPAGARRVATETAAPPPPPPH